MAEDNNSDEPYVADDALHGSYAPADEYVIFHVEAEKIGKDQRPIQVAFFEADVVARRKFFGFIAKTCSMVALIMGGVYVIQQHYTEDAVFYAAIDGERMLPTPISIAGEASIPSRIRVIGSGTSAMKNLMAGSIDNTILALDVRGVRVTANGSRALIGSQIVKSGDSVWAGRQKIIFRGVEGERMVFEDAHGRSYLRNLKATPPQIAMKS
ncbi:MAG: hypothetical protein LBI34_00580 [Puniceicoccales bacterium]|nr:hypothetical protein [Puniceicoccales bacterium]